MTEPPTREERLAAIEREWRHANATRSTPTDSWLNGYQEDVRWLLDRLEERERLVAYWKSEAGRFSAGWKRARDRLAETERAREALQEHSDRGWSQLEQVIRVAEGEDIPEGCQFLRVLDQYEEPGGTGTASRRVYVLLVAREEARGG